MRQTCAILSTYTADVSGVCSALYEMGGMTVMHDASGCNSTYNTHDEPRWYDIPSLVFISALAEVEALMGDEEKLIGDVCRAAEELRPRFIALAGTPIPMMMGTDFKGIARVIEERTGIPTFGFATNGMNSYNVGAGMALAAVARRFCDPGLTPPPLAEGERPSVNLLGVTPLDFSVRAAPRSGEAGTLKISQGGKPAGASSVRAAPCSGEAGTGKISNGDDLTGASAVCGNAEAMKMVFEDAGFHVNSCWAMGSPWEELMNAGRAHVNVVVSSCGAPLAEALREIYGTPSVTGLPVGDLVARELFSLIDEAAQRGGGLSLPLPITEPGGKVFVIGEPVQSASIARALERDYAMRNVRMLAPLDSPDEDEVFRALREARLVIADPLYKPALPKHYCRFIALPHEGYSGRIFRDNIPLIMGGEFNRWIERELAL
ncbi:nitrogenase component 1 [Cloacibacillus porcorum]|uniref:nitrogenase component 1 n=1 Tax=Cloacibacillus porcorum TaxID=1197717 RepID=UPI0026715683|nr:nitrogenase component 1 [Cloacibacillus porcorum]